MDEQHAGMTERIVRDFLGVPSTSNANITIHGTTNWQLTGCMAAAALGVAFGFFGMHTADKTESRTRAELAAMQQEMDQAEIKAQTALAVMQRKLDRIEDYQTTSYMLLPKLREQIEESLNKRKPQEK